MASLFPAGPGFGGSIHVAILVLLLLFFSKESEAGTKRFGDCSRAHCENGRTGEFTGAGNDVALFRARLLADQTRRGGYLMLGGTGPARRIALRRPESIRAPGLAWSASSRRAARRRRIRRASRVNGSEQEPRALLLWPGRR